MGNTASGAASSAATGDAVAPATVATPAPLAPQSAFASASAAAPAALVPFVSPDLVRIRTEVERRVDEIAMRCASSELSDMGVRMSSFYPFDDFRGDLSVLQELIGLAERVTRLNNIAVNREALALLKDTTFGNVNASVLAHVQLVAIRARPNGYREINVFNEALFMHDVQVAQKLAVYATFVRSVNGADGADSDVRDIYMSVVGTLCGILNERMTRLNVMNDWPAALNQTKSIINSISYLVEQVNQWHWRNDRIGDAYASDEKLANWLQGLKIDIARAQLTSASVLLPIAEFVHTNFKAISTILALYSLIDRAMAQRYFRNAKRLRYYALNCVEPRMLAGLKLLPVIKTDMAEKLTLAGVRVAELSSAEERESVALAGELEQA